jgi:HEAT repeat protein
MVTVMPSLVTLRRWLAAIRAAAVLGSFVPLQPAVAVRPAAVVRSSAKRRGTAIRSAVAALAFAAVAPVMTAVPAGAQRVDERVTQAALGTWVHGVTDEIAEREVGEAGVPALIRLLADPSFPRRDNVVAFLGHLGGADATRALVRFLESPPASLTLPQEDRALLLAPQALGQIARRRDPAAADILLDITEHGSNGGVLALAASRAPNPAAMRDDLLEMALRGLGQSGDARARGRLQAVAAGQIRPAATGRDLRGAAAVALEILESLDGGGPPQPPPAGPPLDGEGGAAVAPVAAAGGAAVNAVADEVAFLADAVSDTTHSRVNDSRLTYANHPAVTSPMTDARLDQILAAASLRMGKSDFAEDVACCAGVTRSGTQKTFGSAGDGLDVIDNSTELNSVLNNTIARVKVVRVINYCGGTGTNIIGCAWVGGNGMALVRYGDVGNEGALWAHEYGHNVGLGHNTDSRYIMYGCLCGNNFGVSASECNLFHTPSGGAGASLVDGGACTDADADQVQDGVDNCPGAPNYNQLDSDGDGVGDVCEGGCGNGVIDGTEECDGSAFGGATCSSEGFDGGTLTCTPSCLIETASCTDCGDGVREGSEQCDGADLGGASCGAQGCTTGAPTCGLDCTVSYASCGGCPVCDHDGVCETEEVCGTCGSDCVSSAGAFCGNGVCEPTIGEDCLSCAADCAGAQGGKPSSRYCCGDGAGSNPVTCSDSRCTQGARECSNVPASPSCCGDLACGGIENSFNCALDCGPPPACAPTETSCTNGVDDDCDSFLDCADSNCSASSSCAPVCRPKNSSCTSSSQCCSNRCKGSGVCA